MKDFWFDLTKNTFVFCLTVYYVIVWAIIIIDQVLLYTGGYW